MRPIWTLRLFALVAAVAVAGAPAVARADVPPTVHTVKYQYHGRTIVLHEVGLPHKLAAESAPTDREIHAHGVNRRTHYRLTVVR